MNSFKRVRAFQIELEFGSVGFLLPTSEFKRGIADCFCKPGSL